jgi:hypothetical protein
MLYCPPVCFGFKDGDQPTLNLLFGTELKTGHVANDVSVELLSAEGFAP